MVVLLHLWMGGGREGDDVISLSLDGVRKRGHCGRRVSIVRIYIEGRLVGKEEEEVRWRRDKRMSLVPCIIT